MCLSEMFETLPDDDLYRALHVRTGFSDLDLFQRWWVDLLVLCETLLGILSSLFYSFFSRAFVANIVAFFLRTLLCLKKSPPPPRPLFDRVSAAIDFDVIYLLPSGMNQL